MEPAVIVLTLLPPLELFKGKSTPKTVADAVPQTSYLLRSMCLKNDGCG